MIIATKQINKAHKLIATENRLVVPKGEGLARGGVWGGGEACEK